MNICTVYRPDVYYGEKRTFIVLGAPRGGTSVVAGSMQILGVPMGAVGHQHEDPEFTNSTTLLQKKQTVALRNASHRKWGWKFPDNIYYVDDLIDILNDPIFVVVFRNPLKIMNSAVKHDGDKLHKGHFCVPFEHYYKLNAVIAANPTIPTFLFSFEDIVANVDAYIEDISAILKIKINQDMLVACKEFINPHGYREIDSKR